MSDQNKSAGQFRKHFLQLLDRSAVQLKGPAGEVKHLADHMLSMRGVRHGKLIMTSTGKSLK